MSNSKEFDSIRSSEDAMAKTARSAVACLRPARHKPRSRSSLQVQFFPNYYPGKIPGITRHQEQTLHLFDRHDKQRLVETGMMVPTALGDSILLKHTDPRTPRPHHSPARELPLMLGSRSCFEFLGFSETPASAMATSFYKRYYRSQQPPWEFHAIALAHVETCPLSDISQPGSDIRPLMAALGVDAQTQQAFLETGDALFDDDMSVKRWAVNMIVGRSADLRQVAARSSQRGQEIRDGKRDQLSE